MTGITKLIITMLVAALGLANVADARLVKVPRRFNVAGFFGGYATPLGSYDGIDNFVDISMDGRPLDVDGSEMYDPSVHFGFDYGQVRNGHIMFTLGFRYTHIDQQHYLDLEIGDVNDTIVFEGNAMFFEHDKPSVNRYDIDFNLNYMFFNIADKLATPYLGLGFASGMTTATADGFDSESFINVSLAANFGGEIKIWESSRNRGFLTLASVNSYQFLSSGNRARYATFGLGVRYYFRS